jgi:hypothetical protein
MQFEEFWNSLSNGGKTPEGDEYNVVNDDKLHIRSPGNTNLKYYITKNTVKRYFEKAIPIMGETKFRQKRSSYFYNIYRHIIKK